MGRPFIVLVTAPITGHRDRSLRRDRHQWQTHCPRGRPSVLPIKYHGSSVIVSGDPTMIIDGKARCAAWR